MRKLITYLFLFLCVTMISAQNKSVSTKKLSTLDVGGVMDGKIDGFIKSFLMSNSSEEE